MHMNKNNKTKVMIILTLVESSTPLTIEKLYGRLIMN